MKVSFFRKSEQDYFRSRELNKIDRRLIWFFSLVLLLIMMIVFIVSSFFYTRAGNREQERLATIVAKIVNESVHRVSFSGKYHSRLFLSSLSTISPDIRYILLIDSNGKVLAHSDPSHNDDVFDLKEVSHLLELLRTSPEVIQKLQTPDGSVIEVNLPYRAGYNQEWIGILKIGIDTNSRDRATFLGVTFIFLFIIVLLAVAIPVILLGVKRISEPVFQIVSLLHAVKNSTPDLIFYKDMKLQNLGCNESFSKFVGLSPDQIRGRSESEFMEEGVATIFRRYDIEVLESGKTRSYGEWVHTRTGQDVYLNFQVSPMLRKDGTLFGLVGLVRDQSHSRMLEEEMISMNRTLESRVEDELKKRRENERLLIHQSRLAALGEMIGNIAHQWRQPLTILSLQIQDIEEAKNDGDLSEDYINNFTERSLMIIDQMSRTIDDFRNFFKPNKEKVEFNAEETIREAVNLVSGSFRSNEIQVQIDLSRAVLIYGYRNEYSQVILNILNNARDVLAEGKETDRWIEITESIDPVSGKNEIRIRNNGGEIDPTIETRIYDPYFTTKHKSSGTGIGLYMCKMIIEENMGGRIWHENSDGCVTFVIQI